MDDIYETLELIKKTDAVPRCFDKAKHFANKACRMLDIIQDSVYKTALLDLA